MHPQERVLAQIRTDDDAWQLAGRCRLPFAQLCKMLRSLEADGLVAGSSSRLRLTAAGARRAPHLLELSPRRWAALQARFTRLTDGRPAATADYDQGHITVASTIERVRTFARFGDLWEGVRVALLGDDDLLSVALALTGMPERVTVFEIDQRLVEFIGELADRHRLPIEISTHDLARPLPREQRGCYDTFLCDPPEADAGLRMFLNRGLMALRPGPGSSGYVAMGLIEADYDKWRWLQRWLSSQQLALTAIEPDHSLYENWPTQAEEALAYGVDVFATAATRPWYRTALWRVETLASFEPPRAVAVTGDPIADENYFAQASRARSAKAERR